jgi:hypothetical protein
VDTHSFRKGSGSILPFDKLMVPINVEWPATKNKQKKRATGLIAGGLPTFTDLGWTTWPQPARNTSISRPLVASFARHQLFRRRLAGFAGGDSRSA